MFVRSGADAGLLTVEVQLIPTEFDRVPLCARAQSPLHIKRLSLLETAVTKTKAEEIHHFPINWEMIERVAAK